MSLPPSHRSTLYLVCYYIHFRNLTTITQLQRHGARFPTTKATGNISSAVFKLRSATTYTDPSLQFLTNYTYSLGENDSVPLGALQYATGISVFLDLLIINLQV